MREERRSMLVAGHVLCRGDRRTFARHSLRTFVLLAGLYLAGSVAAQSPEPQPFPSLKSDTQTGTGEPSAAPGAPSPAAPKNAVAKGFADKVGNLAARREFAKAVALIDEALAKDKGNAELLRLRATVHCRAANIKLCLADAHRAVEADDDYVPAHLFRALELIDAGQPKDAIGDCETTIKVWPERPLGYNCRGLANRALREFAQALADFDEAIRRDPKFAIAYFNRGVTSMTQERPQDAIASFSAAIAINGKHDDSFAQRGRAHLAMGDLKAARADFTTALSLNPRNPAAILGTQVIQVGIALDALGGKK
jgi:tetratricopeptide (TPR) repeat protein